MVTILLTGATGFIGSHLARFLDNRGYTVRCLTRKTSNLDQLSGVRARIYIGDITKKETLPHALRGVDIVLHLAAIRGEKPTSMSQYWAVNVGGTANLLEACQAEAVPRFVYCSTVGVMGWPKNPPANESQPLDPIGAYHLTKAHAEELVREYARQGIVAGTVLRLGITYGTGDRDGWVLKLARLLRNGRFIWVGKGTNRVHLLAMGNLVQAFHTVIKNNDSIGETLIIGDPQPITMDRVVRTICDVLRISPPLWRVPVSLMRTLAILLARAESTGAEREPMITPMQVDMITRDRCYDISKARSLGYAPEILTPIGLRRAVEWMKSQRLI